VAGRPVLLPSGLILVAMVPDDSGEGVFFDIPESWPAYKLQSVVAEFVTSATAGNRQVGMGIIRIAGTANIMQKGFWPAPAVQVASETVEYCWYRGGGNARTVADAPPVIGEEPDQLMSIPIGEMIVEGRDSIQIACTPGSLESGDAFTLSGCGIWLEPWAPGPGG
jgi:hypothetical protein